MWFKLGLLIPVFLVFYGTGLVIYAFYHAPGMVDPLATVVGDSDLKDKVTSLLQSNPRVLGYLTIGISVITIAARLRSVAKGA